MRRLVLIGNCQVHSLWHLYLRFVEGAAQQPITYIRSYEEISDPDRAAIETAELIVEQVQNFAPKAEIAGIATKAERMLLPVVNCGFLWPFAGQAHPNNPSPPYLEPGPYGAEISDCYLNRLIAKGTDPDEAAAAYEQLDVNAVVNLDRLYEISIEKQRDRDRLANFKIADVIEEHFRDELVFLTPYHPNTRIAIALAVQFFDRLKVSRGDIERMRRAIRVAPFPKTELPIHPAVARHFGLRYAGEDRRWRFLNEGSFTFREFAQRYVSCTWNEPLEEGLALTPGNDPELAMVRLAEGLALSPDSALGHGAMAHVLDRLDRRDECVAAVRRAIALDPEHAPYRAQLGALLRRQGEHDLAEQAFRQALNLDPCDPHLVGLLANFLRERCRHDEAIAVVRAGLDHAPYAPNLHLELGHLIALSGEPAEAEQAFRRAAALDPGLLDAALSLVDLLEKQGRLNEAADLLIDFAAARPANRQLAGRLSRLLAGAGPSAERAALRAIAVFPDDAGFRADLSEMLERMGRLEEAVAAAREAVRLQPQRAAFQSRIGQLLINSRNFEEAEQALRAAIALEPDIAHHYCQLGNVLSQRGRHAEAIAARERAVVIEPRNPYRLAQLGHVLMNAAEFTAAEETIRKAIALAPDVAEFRLDLSHVLSRAGRLCEAIEAARAGLGLEPGHGRLNAHFGDLLLRIDEVASAEPAYRAAIKCEPRNAHLLGQLSRVLQRLQRNDEALEWAQQAVRLDSGNVGLNAHLASLARTAIADG